MVSYDHVTRYVVKSTPAGNQYLNTHIHAISYVLGVIKLGLEITNVAQTRPHTKCTSLQNTHILWLLPARILPTCMLITCLSIPRKVDPGQTSTETFTNILFTLTIRGHFTGCFFIKKTTQFRKQIQKFRKTAHPLS